MWKGREKRGTESTPKKRLLCCPESRCEGLERRVLQSTPFQSPGHTVRAHSHLQLQFQGIGPLTSSDPVYNDFFKKKFYIVFNLSLPPPAPPGKVPGSHRLCLSNFRHFLQPLPKCLCFPQDSDRSAVQDETQQGLSFSPADSVWRCMAFKSLVHVAPRAPYTCVYIA